MRGLTVIKLGGSHAFAPHLGRWIDAIAGCAGRIVVVPGGGPFADTVREAQPRMGFDDKAAHRMALLAMEQYGCALASMNAHFLLTEARDEIERALDAGRVPIWLPTRMVMVAREIPWSWDVTSDSLAAWLAGLLGASRLLLMKHVAASMPPEELQARGIVDPAFPRFMKESGASVSVLGAGDQATLSGVRELA
jgi:aspartokinase-like uncharacterized kinase